MYKLQSLWSKHIYDFIDYKRSCGFKYERGFEDFITFDKYYISLNLNTLSFSREIVENFLILKPNERVTNQINKASILRQFGKYLFMRHIIDDVYIVPPISAKGEKEYVPYIYTKKQLVKIIYFMENYESTKPVGLNNFNINTINSSILLFKILMSTAMRYGEVINLKLKDIDFNNNLIHIKIAKNDNMRIIPISITLKQEVIYYLDKTPFEINKEDFLLQTKKGTKYSESCSNLFFSKVLKYCGVKRERGKGPRIHDFRHTACCMMLEQLQKNEDNINLSLTYLSSFLGHKSIKETQKYIWLTPSLFNTIKVKMEDYSSFIFERFDEEKYYDED